MVVFNMSLVVESRWGVFLQFGRDLYAMALKRCLMANRFVHIVTSNDFNLAKYRV